MTGPGFGPSGEFLGLGRHTDSVERLDDVRDRKETSTWVKARCHPVRVISVYRRTSPVFVGNHLPVGLTCLLTDSVYGARA